MIQLFWLPIFTALMPSLAPNPKPADAVEVEQVFLLLDYEYGYGGATYPVYNPYVFFKNGIVVKEPYRPLDEIDVKNIDKKIASNWGTWKKTGAKVSIVWHNGKTSEKDWPGKPAYPSVAGEKLAGSFKTLSGGGNLSIGGTVGTFSYSKMSFTPDGFFTNKAVNGANDSRNVAYASKTSAGRYRLDDYTVTLTFNNGETQKLFFCFYDKNKRSFRLGGRTFIVISEKK